MKNKELGELEPLGEEPSDFSLLAASVTSGISSLKPHGSYTGLKNSGIPAVILDTRLNIIWENKKYRELLSPQEIILPRNLVGDFSPYIEPVRLGEIYKALTNRENGFSYQGQLESKKKDRLKVIVNILITPLFPSSEISDTSEPSFYTALFDDLSLEQKGLLQKTFLSLLEASKLKDNDTGNHIKRVGEYSKVMAERMYNLPEYPEVDREFIDSIFFLAPMHDVGKIGTPDDILNKKGPLDDKEWVIMKEHTKNGAYILQAYPDSMAKDIAIFHHEKWNGSGYPYGIEGKTIPLAPRIVALADVYDALRMERSYKKPFSHNESSAIIKKDAGTHFDPDLVQVFVSLENEFRNIFDFLTDF